MKNINELENWCVFFELFADYRDWKYISYLEDEFDIKFNRTRLMIICKAHEEITQEEWELVDRVYGALQVMKSANFEWWEAESEEEKAYWQYKNPEHLLMRFEKFHNGVEKLLDRDVYLEEYFSYDFEKELEITYKIFMFQKRIKSLINIILHPRRCKNKLTNMARLL